MFRMLLRIIKAEALIMSALSDLATKLDTDIDAFKAAAATKAAADAATIADLQAQLEAANAALTALQATDADTQAAIVTLTNADAKLV